MAAMCMHNIHDIKILGSQINIYLYIYVHLLYIYIFVLISIFCMKQKQKLNNVSMLYNSSNSSTHIPHFVVLYILNTCEILQYQVVLYIILTYLLM